MSTANDIVSRALRLLGVIASGETIEASIGADALATLNTLGRRWLASGLIPAWTDATGLTSTLVTATSADEAMAYALAERIAPEYLPGVPEVIAQRAASELQLLWRDRLVQDDGTTANSLILRALRLLATAAKLPDSVDFDGALATLNALLAEWGAAGFGFTAPTYATTAAAITLPTEDHDAVSANLAVRLALEYGIDPTPLAGGADFLLSRLYSRYSAPSY